MNYINNQSSDQKYAIDTLAEIKKKISSCWDVHDIFFLI